MCILEARVLPYFLILGFTSHFFIINELAIEYQGMTLIFCEAQSWGQAHSIVQAVVELST